MLDWFVSAFGFVNEVSVNSVTILKASLQEFRWGTNLREMLLLWAMYGPVRPLEQATLYRLTRNECLKEHSGCYRTCSGVFKNKLDPFCLINKI